MMLSHNVSRICNLGIGVGVGPTVWFRVESDLAQLIRMPMENM